MRWEFIDHHWSNKLRIMKFNAIEKDIVQFTAFFNYPVIFGHVIIMQYCDARVKVANLPNNGHGDAAIIFMNKFSVTNVKELKLVIAKERARFDSLSKPLIYPVDKVITEKRQFKMSWQNLCSAD